VRAGFAVFIRFVISVDAIFRAHGANPEKLYEAAGIPMPERIIDFSTNTNVYPWYAGLEVDLFRCLSVYPDDEATELKSIVAERERCSPDNVLFVNGSNEAIYLIASFLTGKKAAVLQPSYGEYLRALSAHGAKVKNLFSTEELKNCDAFFLCNPRNPTGEYIEAAKLEALFAGSPETLFVVDEAYVDFLTGPREKINFQRHENVILLRSLTKIFHLCGARLGYVLACRERIGRLKSRQPTWSVNAFAQIAGAAFMKDSAFVRKTREFYASETPRFIAALQDRGFVVRPTRTNFFLIETSDDLKLIRSLLARGIVARHTRNFPGLDGSYIRVATRLPEENDFFVRAVREIEEQA
jgi:threonine-phosphate decarboxylase